MPISSSLWPRELLKVRKNYYHKNFGTFFPIILKSSRASTEVEKCFAVTFVPISSSLWPRELLKVRKNYYHKNFGTFFPNIFTSSRAITNVEKCFEVTCIKFY